MPLQSALVDSSVNTADAMDFRLTDEQLAFQRTCREFAAEVIRPAAERYDREQEVPWDILREARRRNMYGLDLIQQFATDGMAAVLYAEEMHWGCAGIALALSASSLAAAGIASAGTPDQLAQWVPQCYGIGDDDIKLGAYAVTEPQAGSDVKSLRTTAKRDGDDWILNGTKVFISNGGIADVTVVVATVDPELGHRGQASFIVEKDTPGFSLGKKEDKMGIRASQTGELVLEDVRVPMDHLLGGLEKLERKLERGRTGEQSRSSGALATFETTRPIVGAGALGIARAAYEWTLDFLEGREESGEPLLDQQRVQQVLADVAMELDAARLLVYRAAWMSRSGMPMTAGQGSMSKLKAGEVAMWCTTALMDLVGPEAASEDHPMQKYFRDAKIFQLFEGTSQIQRLVIARMQTAERRKDRAEAADEAPGEGAADGPVSEPAPATA